MSNVFTIADPHFHHKGVCIFSRNDGSKLRPWDTPEEMNEALVDNWNSVVKPSDKVYVLGDIQIAKGTQKLEILDRLNGDKVLVMGNHDICGAKAYLKHFRDVRGVHVWDKCVLTHIPVHPESGSRWRMNVHGHTHSNVMMCQRNSKLIDPFYIGVSMEQEWVNFKPVEWGELMQVAAKRNDAYLSSFEEYWRAD